MTSRTKCGSSLPVSQVEFVSDWSQQSLGSQVPTHYEHPRDSDRHGLPKIFRVVRICFASDLLGIPWVQLRGVDQFVNYLQFR
jgi:hypothetical protein